MNYCKITTDKQAMMMPNPFRLVIANPTDEQKSLIAQLDNWLEMVYTEEPPYNPEYQYLTQYWEAEEVSGVVKAVQHWEVHGEVPQEEVGE